jgi:hypothetical protein
VVEGVDLARVVEVRDAERLLDLGDALFGQDGVSRLLVDGEVGLLLEARDDAVDDVVLFGRLFGGTLMMSGVLASSIRIESTSSTIA